MFDNRVVVSCVALFMSALIAPATAQADDACEHMAQALANVAAEVLRDVDGFGYDRNISLLGAYVRRGETVKLNRYFTVGETYRLLGNGDNRVIDVDIDVLDANGNAVAYDRRPNTLADVQFTPWQSGQYTISLRLDRSQAPWSFCGLAILRRGGWKVPAGNLIDAAARCLTRCREVAGMTKHLRFHDEPSQWSLLGGVLEQGEGASLTNLHLGTGPRIFVAAGDDHAQDIDLFLGLNGSTTVLNKDDDRDAVPIFEQVTLGNQLFDLRLRNERSCHASLMFAAVLAN